MLKPNFEEADGLGISQNVDYKRVLSLMDWIVFKIIHLSEKSMADEMDNYLTANEMSWLLQPMKIKDPSILGSDY